MQLEEEVAALLEALQGKSPFSARTKHKIGWGSSTGKYSVATGYSAIQVIPWVPPDPTPWRNLWNYPSLPKIDFFCWTLLHKSILTSENLKRKGWEWSSRCPLCKEYEETTDHVFLLWSFAREVWSLILGPLRINLPSLASELICTWLNQPPFSLFKKNLLK